MLTAAKCLITTDDQDRFLVVTEFDQQDGYSARLPLLIEINEEILSKCAVKKIFDSLLLVNSHQEVSPWELFVTFPTSEFSDYGYVAFDDKAGNMTAYWPDKPQEKSVYSYWELLNDIDKQLVEKYLEL